MITLKTVWGQTLPSVVQNLVHELYDDDGVRLGVIIRWGRDFGLSGEDLTAFVRQTVAVLLERGAYPVPGPYESMEPWERMTKFGEGSDEVANNIVKDWLKNGDPEPLLGLWFHLPQSSA